ncbi:MAG TPA: outer membrane beta-barrel protein [Burkholderiales bacterium]|nr:outer membrane beta-barrel protein [Burkholderiales bacterium]
MGLLRTALPYLGTVIGLAAMDAALAQQRAQTGIPSAPAWYIGAGAGVSYYDMNQQDLNMIPSVTTQGFDSTGFGWKLFGGYRFNPYLGLEGSYADLGSSSGGLKYAVHSWNVAGVGRLPFASGFYLQGKVGAAFTRAQSTPFGQTVGNTSYKTNVLLGGGFGYDFPSGVGVLAEAEWYGKTGTATGVDPSSGLIVGTGRADSYLFSVSTMFRF